MCVMLQPERSLQEMIALAERQLRKLFPGSLAVRRLDAKAVVASSRCQERACVYPAMANGRCRLHLIDAVAEASTLPSTLGFVVTPLHGHGYQAQASRSP